MLKTPVKTLLFVSLILMFLIRIGHCQITPKESITYIIKLDEKCAAFWTVEQRYLLETEEEKRNFQLYLDYIEENKDRYLRDFSELVVMSVNKAMLLCGRPMSAQNFTLITGFQTTHTAVYGIIQYNYVWFGFLKNAGNYTEMGDVFYEGFFLYKDDTLIVEYPSNWRVITASPEPNEHRVNEQKLIWYGQRSFVAGTPYAIYEEAPQDVERNPLSNLISIIAIFILPPILGFGIAGFLFFRYRKRKEGGGEEPSRLVPPIASIMESDENKVLRLLSSSKNGLLQSMITAKCGFSKSKTSQLLASMESKGLIKRIKRGREKLVTLQGKIKEKSV